MNQVRYPTIVAVLLVSAGAAAGKTLHVPTTDYPTIQAAIVAAAPGDKIAVAPGTYTENINFLGKAIHLHSRSRDPANTTIHGTGSGSVVTCNSNETSATILEGFTITGGNASTGGGMLNHDSSPTVTNCTFSNNFRNGMFSFSSSPTVTDCTFSNNGVAMDNYGGSLIVTNCTVTNNGTGIGGSGTNHTVTNCIFSNHLWHGMHGSRSRYAVTDCTFSGNTVHGMYNYDNYYVEVSGCTFTDNGGTGMFNARTREGTVTSCTFGGNSVGMYNLENDVMTVSNCLFSRNSSDGMQNYSCPAFPLTNCTFGSNSGDGIYNSSSNPTVTNCILWFNAGGSIVGDPGTVTYSDVEGGWTGEGNTNADPLFVNAGGGDFHLASGSPCIDAGTNSPPGGLLSTDIEGNPRPVDGDGDKVAVADMGAYEASGKHRPPRK